MPTDPFVPSELADRPRQQQNLPPGLAPPPARDWRADRPGDLGGAPADGRAARPARARTSATRTRSPAGPATRLRLVAARARRRRRSRWSPRSRASAPPHFGRAPVMADIDVAIALLGYDGVADDAFVELARPARARRRARLHRAGASSSTRCPTTLLRDADGRAARPRRRVATRRRSRLDRSPSRPDARDARSFFPTSTSSCGRRCGGSPRSTSRRTRPRPTSARSTRGRAGTRGATPASRAWRSPRSTAVRAAGSSRTRSRSRRSRGSARRRRCSRSSRSSAMTPVLDHGSEELKQKYVPRVAAGECQASYCLSEADAGSDVSGMRTRAVRDGDHYVLTGRKLWITNAGVSDFYTVFAKTDPDAGHRGISCFVVEKAFPGLQRRRSSSASSVCAARRPARSRSTSAPVPAENLIGDEGRGFHYAMGALDRSRPLVGAQALGIAQRRARARDRATCGSAGSSARGSPTSRDCSSCSPTWRRRSTRRALLVYRACSLLDAGLPGTGERVVDGEALRVRHRDARHDRLRAAARRRRLHEGPARPSASCATPRSPRSTRAPTRSSGS